MHQTALTFPICVLTVCKIIKIQQHCDIRWKLDWLNYNNRIHIQSWGLFKNMESTGYNSVRHPLKSIVRWFFQSLCVSLVQGARKTPDESVRVNDLAIALPPGLVRYSLRDLGSCIHRLLEGRIDVVGVQVQDDGRSVQRWDGMYTVASQHCTIISAMFETIAWTNKRHSLGGSLVKGSVFAAFYFP